MSRKFWILIGVSIIVIVLILTFNWWYLNDIPLESRGVYGDMYGFSNTLFSGLAFVGVIAAILIQSEELKLQRNELKATRAEFEQQNATLKKQSFENTLFNLIDNSHKTLERITILESKLNARSYISDITADMLNKFNSLNQGYNSPMSTNEEKRSISEFHRIHRNTFEKFKKSSISLSPWIKNISSVVELIQQAEILHNERLMYERIFWNQFSDNEIKLLVAYLNFNVLYKSKSKDVLEKSILNDLSIDILRGNQIIYFNQQSQDH
ncbi:hypothetical protein [Leeuwenhoekiella marinoflava]|uniref:Phage abortive infection protein n=2 Tax=Leeuwenhoekiella marinoflava TaxID=988 RepID=A0A4V1KSK4_9FLAO|nr:hypothetical protein [Leeuwenhoekiella marinoflava]RXG32048.1 hypothetical protein DSL99_1353 [Leeuwenhoekiella marinoflava]SHE96110.1 hypothetical protein SAMN02745246_01408 [Leeuwenhoekiella marinoflava DSM 3653]